MIRINQIRLLVGNEDKIRAKIIKKLKLKPDHPISYEIVRRSLDARKKPELYYNYIVDVSLGNENTERRIYRFPFQSKHANPVKRPVIVGTGPAGLFCGYMLAMAGFKPILLERGEAVEERVKTVERFFTENILNPDSNVQFGEGGAGTFSDGKLNTQIKDREGLKRAVLSVLTSAGAPEDILYEQKPHLGTDKLVNIVREVRTQIISAGGEFHFGQKVTGFKFDGNKVIGVIVNDETEIISDHVVLAIGHSARDTFEVLYENGFKMETKPFAVGLRVEHPQILINKALYGVDVHELLGAADYKLVSNQKNPSVFSFCMCPGGYIVNASSEEKRLVVNGMSYSDRAGGKANSAIVIPISLEDLASGHPLAGIGYQRRLEEKAFEIGKGKIPIQLLGDFRNAVSGEPVQNRAISGINPSTKGSYSLAPVHEILSKRFNRAFIEAMTEFGHRIPGFDNDETIIAGVESRTSSPVRILRDETMQSNYRGIYPCGEGAGYAGGIMSAAIDGIRIAEAVARDILRLDV